MAPHHPNSFFGWVDLLTATPGLVLLHGSTPHGHLESRDGHKRWSSAAVDRWAVHNNPQSVDPIEQSRIEKKISKCQVLSFCSLKITLSTQNSFLFFKYPNFAIWIESGLNWSGWWYIHSLMNREKFEFFA